MWAYVCVYVTCVFECGRACVRACVCICLDVDVSVYLCACFCVHVARMQRCTQIRTSVYVIVEMYTFVYSRFT